MRRTYTAIIGIVCCFVSSTLATTIPIDATPWSINPSVSSSPKDTLVGFGQSGSLCPGNSFQRFEIPNSQLALLFEFEGQLQLSDVKGCLVSAGAWLSAQRKTAVIPEDEFTWPDGPVELEVKGVPGNKVTWQNVIDVVEGLKIIEYVTLLEHKAIHFEVQVGNDCGPIIATGNIRKRHNPSSTVSTNAAIPIETSITS